MAQNYYDDSKALRITYPETSKILEKLGDIYKQEHRYEQQQELLDFRE